MASLLYGMVAGAGYALLALGFGLVYFTTGVFHFAHGAVFAAAGYTFWYTYQVRELPLPLAAALSLAVAAALGWFVEVGLYRPLRRRRAPLDVQFLTSLGFYTAVSNALALGWGHEAQPLSRLANPSYVLGTAPGGAPLVITASQIATLIAAALVLAGLVALFKLTSFGLAVRAYAANPALAEAWGLDGRRLLPAVAVLGALLAGVAAACVAADVGVTPDMGLAAVVTGAVAVVVGGIGSLPGTALAGLLLGLAQHAFRYRFAARWEEAVTFALLLLVLLLRPRGILGRRSD
ncbi:MAG: hypothetical protein HYU66_26050 [Armatimonadetes bacterium]|nr:hypothetical protein [Armatimonadota bacterium]